MSGSPDGPRPSGDTHEPGGAGADGAPAGTDDLAARLEAWTDTAHGAQEDLHRYRELFDAAPDPAFITDRRGRVLHANRAALELLDGGVRAVRPWRKPLAVYLALPDRHAFRTALARGGDGPGTLRLALGPPGVAPRPAEVRVVHLPGGDAVLWAARLDDDVMI